MSPFERLLAALADRAVRFVVVGVSAANYYARSAGTLFATQDRDLLLPPEPDALLGAWRAAKEAGFELWAGREPLGEPVDRLLARRVIERRARTEAVHPAGEQVDLMVEIAGLGFDRVWRERRTFRLGELAIPVARLSHVVESKAAAGRPKDRLFLETYDQALRELIDDDDSG